MNRGQTLEVFATGLAVVSVAVIAATFERGTLEFGFPAGFGRVNEVGNAAPVPDVPFHCPAIVGEWYVVGPLVGVLVGLGILAHRTGRRPVLSTLAATVSVAGLLAVCPVPVPSLPTGTVLPPLPWWEILVAGFWVLVAVQVFSGFYAWYRMSGDPVWPGGYSTVESDEPVLSELADAAGSAADRIEEPVATENGVYRAWQEMTALLDVQDPETTTPEEFADAAIEAGMDREHVDLLTTLFRDVRYGGRDADEREQRAVEVLRRIEREYGGEEE